MRIKWDEQNLDHIQNQRGFRKISQEEVEEVIRNPISKRRQARGRVRDLGRTTSGRSVTVVVEVLSSSHVRPRTAWENRR